jgi:hypothetical protein
MNEYFYICYKQNIKILFKKFKMCGGKRCKTLDWKSMGLGGNRCGGGTRCREFDWQTMENTIFIDKKEDKVKDEDRVDMWSKFSNTLLLSTAGLTGATVFVAVAPTIIVIYILYRFLR